MLTTTLPSAGVAVGEQIAALAEEKLIGAAIPVLGVCHSIGR